MLIVDTPPPLLKSLMTRTSPFACTPVKPEPPPTLLLPRVIRFWKNQNPCWASPLLSKRSEPKKINSQVGFVPDGQFVLGGAEYRAANPCSRLSLSGNPPTSSFQAHWLISIGSLDPPPVKKLLFE